MQIIVNCYVPWHDGIVMLQKPRRGWWVLPGGKVEPQETWPDAVRREVWEETGIELGGVSLLGIHLLITQSGEGTMTRTIAQFAGSNARGHLVEASNEGKVQLIHASDVGSLPMNEGDRIMLQHTLASLTKENPQVAFGKFTYTPDEHLLNWSVTYGDS